DPDARGPRSDRGADARGRTAAAPGSSSAQRLRGHGRSRVARVLAGVGALLGGAAPTGARAAREQAARVTAPSGGGGRARAAGGARPPLGNRRRKDPALLASDRRAGRGRRLALRLGAAAPAVAGGAGARSSCEAAAVSLLCG